MQVYSAKNLLEYAGIVELTIHQPKKPPIPEDAVILADYMLLADFVPQGSQGDQYISKGIRRQSISRDVFFEETDGDSFTLASPDGSVNAHKLYLSGTADTDT